MNFNKHKFTKEEFLDLPVFETARLAPKEQPFLLQGRMSNQKEYLMDLISKHGDELGDLLEKQGKQQLRVTFWRRYKDGNVQDCGGHITFPKIGLNLDGEKLVINTGGSESSITVD
jgi:hypothetical protein